MLLAYILSTTYMYMYKHQQCPITWGQYIPEQSVWSTHQYTQVQRWLYNYNIIYISVRKRIIPMYWFYHMYSVYTQKLCTAETVLVPGDWVVVWGTLALSPHEVVGQEQRMVEQETGPRGTPCHDTEWCVPSGMTQSCSASCTLQDRHIRVNMCIWVSLYTCYAGAVISRSYTVMYICKQKACPVLESSSKWRMWPASLDWSSAKVERGNPHWATWA